MNKLDFLQPLKERPVQSYFSNIVQISDVMEWVLKQIGKSDIIITTYSTSEEFIRKVARLKNNDLIGECSLICDIRAARKTLSIYNFLKSTFDEVLLAENHSKVILFKNQSHPWVAVITSQNQTRGNRYECGIITTDFDVVDDLCLALYELKNKSRKLNELITTAD